MAVEPPLHLVETMKRKAILPVVWVITIFLAFVLGGGYGYNAGKQIQFHRDIQKGNVSWTISD